MIPSPRMAVGLEVENSADAKATLEVLLIAGIPLDEPVELREVRDEYLSRNLPDD